jgi:hypothetical protein
MILWSLRVHYRCHKNSSLIPVLSRTSPHRPVSLKSILILFIHLRLGLDSGLFLSGSPSSILYPFPFSSILPHSLSHLHPEKFASCLAREAVGAISDEDIGLMLIEYFQPHFGPGIGSASNEI